MSKRSHELNDKDNDRPLKKQRVLELDMNELPVEVLEKILIWVPKYELKDVSMVCRQWASLTSNPMFWKLSCVIRWGENVYPATLSTDQLPSYDPQFIVPLSSECGVDWHSYYLIRHHLANFLAFRGHSDESELAVTSILVCLEPYVRKETDKNRPLNGKDAKKSYAQVATRVAEILLDQDRDPELVTKLLDRKDNIYYNSFPWLCTRLSRICHLLLLKPIDNFKKRVFPNTYNWLQRCFGLIKEMNQNDCDVFAEMIHQWVRWAGWENSIYECYLDTKTNTRTKNRAMQRVYFEIAKEKINDDVDPVIQQRYLNWSIYNRDVIESNSDGILQLFELEKSACRSKYELIRDMGVQGLSIVLTAQDHLNDEHIMFVYEKFLSTLKSCQQRDVYWFVSNIVKLARRLNMILNDEKFDDLNQTILRRFSGEDLNLTIGSFDIFGTFGTAFGNRLQKYLPEYSRVLLKIRHPVYPDEPFKSLIQLGYHSLGEEFTAEAEALCKQNGFPILKRCTCQVCNHERKKKAKEYFQSQINKNQ